MPNNYEQNIIKEIAQSIEQKTGDKIQQEKIWRAVGCITCNNTGYRGRVGIFEAILMNEEIEALLNAIPSEREIRKIANKQNILTMREDGIEKILFGITSFEEVGRVVDFDKE